MSSARLSDLSETIAMDYDVVMICDSASVTRRLTWGAIKAQMANLNSQGIRRTCFYCRTVQYKPQCECCGARER